MSEIDGVKPERHRCDRLAKLRFLPTFEHRVKRLQRPPWLPEKNCPVPTCSLNQPPRTVTRGTQYRTGIRQRKVHHSARV
jgi:hypothetical protein